MDGLYYDLTPEVNDIPASTWAGVDPEKVRDYLIQQVPEADRHKIGPDTDLRTLTSLGRTAHMKLAEPLPQTSLFTSPRLKALLATAFKEQYLEEADNLGESRESVLAAFEAIDKRYST